MVGKILAKRYVVLEEVAGEGAATRFLVYDMNTLKRVHLRVANDQLAQDEPGFELVDENAPLLATPSITARHTRTRLRALTPPTSSPKEPLARAPSADVPAPSAVAPTPLTKSSTAPGRPAPPVAIAAPVSTAPLATPTPIAKPPNAQPPVSEGAASPAVSPFAPTKPFIAAATTPGIAGVAPTAAPPVAPVVAPSPALVAPAPVPTPPAAPPPAAPPPLAPPPAVAMAPVAPSPTASLLLAPLLAPPAAPTTASAPPPPDAKAPSGAGESTQPLDLVSMEELFDAPPPRVRVRTKQIEAAWFAQGVLIEQEALDEGEEPGTEADHAELVRQAALLSEDEYRKYALDLSPPSAPQLPTTSATHAAPAPAALIAADPLPMPAPAPAVVAPTTVVPAPTIPASTIPGPAPIAAATAEPAAAEAEPDAATAQVVAPLVPTPLVPPEPTHGATVAPKIPSAFAAPTGTATGLAATETDLVTKPNLFDRLTPTKLHTLAFGAGGGLLIGLLFGLLVGGGTPPPPPATQPVVAPPCLPKVATDDGASTAKPKPTDPAPDTPAPRKKLPAAVRSTNGKPPVLPPDKPVIDAKPTPPQKLSRRAKRALRKQLRKAAREYRRHRYQNALVYALRALKIAPGNKQAEALRAKAAVRLGI